MATIGPPLRHLEPLLGGSPPPPPPSAPVLATCTPDYNGRLALAGTIDAATTSVHVYRATSLGGSYSEVTANCGVTLSGTTLAVEDYRPSYGTPSVPLGSTAYYYATAVNANGTSANSNIVSGLTQIDRSAAEQAMWDALYLKMTTDSVEKTGNLGWAYPGYWWLAASRTATSNAVRQAQALSALQDWWNTSKAHLNADGLYVWGTAADLGQSYGASPSSATSMGWQYNVEFGNYALVCARLLNGWLPGDPTATSIATDMRTKANTLGKAMIDKFATYAVTNQRGYGGNWPTVAGATAWAPHHTYSVNDIVKSGTGRMSRCISVDPGAQSGLVEPTWLTTDRATVSETGSGGVTVWQDCTNDLPLWSAGMTVPAGLVIRPSTPNGHTHRAMNSGTTGGSEPALSTTNGGTVTDNGITWKETSASGSIFSAYYDKTTYASLDTTCVTDYLFETAAFFTALMADTNLPDFQSGTYKTSATTIATDMLNLGATAQVGTGAVVQNLGVHGTDLTNKYDTNYGSFIGHNAALVYRNQSDALSLLFVKRMAAWFDAEFLTEPRVSNSGYADSISPGNAATPAELTFRESVYIVAGITWGLSYLSWDSSIHPTGHGAVDTDYVQAGHASTLTTDAAAFPLAALAIEAAVATHYTDAQPGTVTLSGTKTEAWGHTDIASGTLTLSGTAVESKAYVDALSAALALAGTSVETWSRLFADTATGTLLFSGLANGSLVYTDATSGTVTLSGTAIEALTSQSIPGLVSVSTAAVTLLAVSDAAVTSLALSDSSVYSLTLTDSVP